MTLLIKKDSEKPNCIKSGKKLQASHNNQQKRKKKKHIKLNRKRSQLFNQLNSVILFPPGISEKEEPRESQEHIPNSLPDPIGGEILDSALEVDPPEGHEDVEDRTALGEEALEVPVPHEGHHQEEQPDAHQKQPREGVGGADQQLVVRRRTHQPRRRRRAVAQLVHLLHVEHHQAPARYGDQRVENADHEERRRRRRRR